LSSPVQIEAKLHKHLNGGNNHVYPAYGIMGIVEAISRYSAIHGNTVMLGRSF
jgi:RAB protein geranylgeranyltransferase component A